MQTAMDSMMGVTLGAGSSNAVGDDPLLAGLLATYEAILTERARRLAERKRILGHALSAVPACSSMVHAGVNCSFDNEEVASALIRGLISQEGREALGLNPHVHIPFDRLEAKYISTLSPSGSSRDYYRGRYRGHNQTDDGEEAPLSRLDIAGLVGELRRRYSGAAGQALRLSQLADAVIGDLGLERATFEVRAGKVELQVSVYGHRTGGESYGADVEKDLHRFAVVVSHLQAPGDEAARTALAHNLELHRGTLGPGLKIQIGAEAHVRTFQTHYRVVMTQHLAERFRAFVAEHRSQGQQDA